MNSKEKGANNVLKVHFFYVTLILVLIIILLMAKNWTSIDGFTNYLTAAGTIVSIVLGVLAIIYSFVSGDSISRSLGGVASAAEELQFARQEFTSVVNAASEITDVSRASSTELNGLVAAVSKEVRELMAVSTKLSLSTEGIAKKIDLLPERFDTIDIRLDESLTGKKPDHPGPTVPNIRTLENIINYGSNLGAALIYAAALSKEKNKPINLSSESFRNSIDYCYGFLTAVYAADIIDYDNEPDFKILVVNEFPMTSEQVLETIKPAFEADDVRASLLKELIERVQLDFSSGKDEKKVLEGKK